MKKYLMMLCAFTLLLFLLTALPTRLIRNSSDLAVPGAATPTTALSNDSNTGSDASYRMLDITSGKVEEISVRDYLIGAVCAEMPATFEPEALKAQAVAAHTYAERQHLIEQANPTPELCGADFSNDSTQYQAFFTKNQAMRYYEDDFETYYAKITEAVDAVLPYILSYDGEPIIAAFCSMSSGMTESAETVWGSDIAYLTSVESSADTEAPRYLETAAFSQQELCKLIQTAYPDAVWDGDPNSWISIDKTSEAGTVLTVTVGGVTMTGQELRNLLELRSAAFEAAYEDGTFVFTTRGFGHGVGMSQYGANAMAKEGKTWKEILAHYYPNTQVTEIL